MRQKVPASGGAWWKNPVTRAVMSVLILTLLFLYVPLSDLWNALTRLSPGVWALAVVIFFVGHVIAAAKWCLLVNAGQAQLPFVHALRYHFAGLFANLFLPSVAGGDVVRAGLAIRFSGEKGGVVLGSLLDRFVDVCALALLIGIGAVCSPSALEAEGRDVLLWVLLVLAGVALGGLMLLVLPLPRSMPERLVAMRTSVRSGVVRLVKDPRRGLASLGLALIIQSTFVLVSAFMGAAIGIRPALSAWFLAWPLAKVAAMLPISIGGLGVREAALAVFLRPFGVPAAHAIGVGLLWQTVLYAGGALGGLFSLILSRYATDSERSGGIQEVQHEKTHRNALKTSSTE